MMVTLARSSAEFLEASGNPVLRETILSQKVSKPLLTIHHNRPLELLRH